MEVQSAVQSAIEFVLLRSVTEDSGMHITEICDNRPSIGSHLIAAKEEVGMIPTSLIRLGMSR